MEPASILTIVVTSLSVVVKTSLALKELLQKYRSVGQEVTLIIVRLNTIEAIVSQIGSWLQSEKTVQKQVAADVQMAVAACEFVVGEIYSHVQRVREGWFGGKIRHMWNEEQLLQYQRSLDSQISALGVLLNIAVLKSQTQQRKLLESPWVSPTTMHSPPSSPQTPESSRSSQSPQDTIASAVTPISPSTLFQEELFQSNIYKSSLRKRHTGQGIEAAQAKVESPRNFVIRSDTTSGSSSFSLARSVKSEKKRRRYHGTSRLLSEQLHDAVIQDMSSLAATLCSNGADVNYRHQKPETTTRTGIFGRVIYRSYGCDEPTLLHHAAEKGNMDIIRTLVSHGADPNARDKEGKTPLHLAGDEASELLVSLGADPSLKDTIGAIPLHYMAAAGRTNAVKSLVQSGSDVNTFNKLQQTALHLACIDGHRKVVSALVEAGAFVDATDADGLRPLHSAAKHGHDRIVRGLLRAGSNPEMPSKRGWRPIHYAANGTNAKVVQSLLSEPVSVNIETKVADGRTPLLIAISNGYKHIVELLLSAGANIEAADDKGNTSLFLAVSSRRADTLELLIEYGVRVNAPNKDGGTALLEACLSQSSAPEAAALVQTLLEHGARVNTANQAGQTPLSAACGRANSVLLIVQGLLVYGARVNYADYMSLWRNRSLEAWERKAVHGELDAVADDELKKSEVEWLMVAL